MSIFTTLVSYIFPSKCMLCQMPLTSNEKHCCEACNTALPYISTSCGKCSTPLTTTEQLCGFCLSTERHWERCISPFAYIDPLPELIQALKYQNKTHTIHFFADSIIEATRNFAGPNPELLTYVSCHPLRFIDRGYNQSLLLTQLISKKTGIPYLCVFEKIKFTEQQTKLNQKKRIKEPKNTFRTKISVRHHIQKKHIAIIDDVVTSGSTCTELAKILKLAGASRVDVWSIART